MASHCKTPLRDLLSHISKPNQSSSTARGNNQHHHPRHFPSQTQISTSPAAAVALLCQVLVLASCDMEGGYRRPHLAVEASSLVVGLEVVCTVHLAAGESSLAVGREVVYTF